VNVKLPRPVVRNLARFGQKRGRDLHVDLLEFRQPVRVRGEPHEILG
jgi:hypothetical protein